MAILHQEGPLVKCVRPGGQDLWVNAMMVDSVRPSNDNVRIVLNTGAEWIVADDIIEVLDAVTRIWTLNRRVDGSYRCPVTT